MNTFFKKKFQLEFRAHLVALRVYFGENFVICQKLLRFSSVFFTNDYLLFCHKVLKHFIWGNLWYFMFFSHL